MCTRNKKFILKHNFFYLSSSCNVSDLMKLGFIYIRAEAEAKAIFFFDLCRCCCRFNVNRKLDSLCSEWKRLHFRFNKP